MSAISLQIPATLASDLLERLKLRFTAYPLIQGWDLSLESLEPGRARLCLGSNKIVLNLMGTVHGGVLATLADMSCAVALCTAFDGSMPFATSDLHIRYLEPAEGDVLAEAEIVRVSPRSAVLECKLKCTSGIVALCTTHFTITSQAASKANHGASNASHSKKKESKLKDDQE
jgi:uncharacterized protein (TIGR00369 family)